MRRSTSYSLCVQMYVHVDVYCTRAGMFCLHMFVQIFYDNVCICLNKQILALPNIILTVLGHCEAQVSLVPFIFQY